MTSDLDIYRSANLLVKQHGEDAPIRAAMCADAMLAMGDLDGYTVWKHILRAVETPRDGAGWESALRDCRANSERRDHRETAMKRIDAKRLILDEWVDWRAKILEPDEIATGFHALNFFVFLKSEKSHLLDFRYTTDQWQIVHAWLLGAEIIVD